MTEPDTHLPPEVEADLVALADGNLPAARAAELEARVAREPALADALQRQRRALSLLADLSTPAPIELRLRVEELKAQRRRVRRLRWVPAAFLATASATAALLLVLFVGGGPGVEDVFALSSQPATAPASADEQIDGLAFPKAAGGFKAVGARSDEIHGRQTRTVFYERGEMRISFTIVESPALTDGERVLVSGGRHAYSWPRDDHTCVIAGNVDESILRRVAEW
jgi:anti-sigma factor RsiW